MLMECAVQSFAVSTCLRHEKAPRGAFCLLVLAAQHAWPVLA